MTRTRSSAAMLRMIFGSSLRKRRMSQRCVERPDFFINTRSTSSISITDGCSILDIFSTLEMWCSFIDQQLFKNYYQNGFKSNGYEVIDVESDWIDHSLINSCLINISQSKHSAMKLKIIMSNSCAHLISITRNTDRMYWLNKWIWCWPKTLILKTTDPRWLMLNWNELFIQWLTVFKKPNQNIRL